MRNDTQKIIEHFYLTFSGREEKIIENMEASLPHDECILYLAITNLSIVTVGQKRIQVAPDTLFCFTDRRVFLRLPGILKPMIENIPLGDIQSVESREDSENAGHLLFTASGKSYDIMLAQSRGLREEVLEAFRYAMEHTDISGKGSAATDSASATAPEKPGTSTGKSRNYRYFSHKECEYFPCHKGADPDNFNCLFCYCPFYLLGDQCGGNFRYLSTGTKDCTDCLYPHLRENYSKITARYQEIKSSMPCPKKNSPG